MSGADVVFNLPGLAQMILGLAAPLLFLFYFRSRGGFATEGGALWSHFFIGMISTFLIAAVLPLQPIVNAVEPIAARLALDAFLIAAIPEETIKLAVVAAFVWRHHACETPHDLLVMTVAVAAGFSAMENIFYLIESDGWLALAFNRSLLSTPAHVFSAATMGAGLALWRWRGKRWRHLLLVLPAPILMHGLYNYFSSMSATLSESGELAADRMSWLVINGFLGINLVNIVLSSHLSRRLLGEEGHMRRRFALPNPKLLRRWRDALLMQRLFWGTLGAALVVAGGMVLYGTMTMTGYSLGGALAVMCAAHGLLFVAEALGIKRGRNILSYETPT